MTSDEAIQAHRQWKENLRVAMATREILDIEAIASDKCCKFGHWLYDIAKEKFGGSQAYSECLDAHAAFHLFAAEVAAKVNEGKLLEADKMMASGTPYAKCSEMLAVKVTAMFKASSVSD
jgi:hypothetical protein